MGTIPEGTGTTTTTTTRTTSAASGPDTGDAGTSTGTSGAVETGSSGGVAPTYAPFVLADCDDGQLGARADGADALASVVGNDAPSVVYSDREAVDGIGQSCMSVAFAERNFFGGRYVSLQDDGVDVVDGDDVWMRHALYFPDGFCFGFGVTSGDGWGATKWMRVEFDNVGPQGSPGSRLTLQLGNFASQACSDAASVWGATREYAGNANLRPRQTGMVTPGEWHMVQWQIHLAADDTGYVRFWLDETYLGQVDAVTMSAPEHKIAFIQYGDYWNGSPHQDVTWYLDEVIMTKETPGTTDEGGRPYIAPTARVDDWD